MEALAVSAEARRFAAKTARSISEIQQSVNNMADVLVFLEVLGYDEELVKRNGFESMRQLARYVYEFVDAFDEGESAATLAVQVPTTGRRIAEALSMVFPWVGALALLFISGVSLWMAWGLPREVTTLFLAGVFLGLVITEGFSQSFQRVFSFYYSQSNIGEVKRSIKRNYSLLGIVLCGAVATIYLLSSFSGISFQLASVAAVSAVTVALHRMSFVILYALRKMSHLIVAYAGAFLALGLVYFMMSPAVPDPTVRYFAGLAAAFGVLSGFAIYHHYKIIGQSSASILAKDAPHFYSPLTVNDDTLTSRFGVQLWESLPLFVYGISYFAIMFADRILSWVFNPVTTVTAAGTVLPISFNSVYHVGADLALLVLFPAIIIQHILASPAYILVHNRALNIRVWERSKIDQFLKRSYIRLIAGSIVASCALAVAVNLFQPEIMHAIGGTAVSAKILLFASVGAVLLAAFGANGLYMVFLGRLKALAVIALLSAGVVIAGGVFMAGFGFENIVFAYVAGTAVAAAASFGALARFMKEPSSLLFARFI